MANFIDVSGLTYCGEEYRNIFAKDIVAVNVGTLDKKFEDGAVVDIDALVEAGVLKNSFDGVKILSNGTLKKSLTVKATAFSKSAKEKIEAAGGKAEVV